MEHDTQAKPHRERPTPGLSGKWMVLLTLSLFLVVPAVTYLAWQITQGEPPRVSLDYADRDHWLMMPVSPRPLNYNTFVAAETGKQYKKTDLYIEPEVEQALLRCAQWARGDDFFSEPVRNELLQLAEQETFGFYPPYLVASWHRYHEHPDEHDKWMQVAFDRAGGALAQKLVDEQGEPVAGYAIPPVAIGYDRVIEGERDASLVLIYPYPVSDADGFVYLPTFRSIYRLTDPALPAGTDPGVHPRDLTLLPQKSDGPVPNWFAVPDGAVGRFGDAVISERDRVIQETIKILSERVEPGRRPLPWRESEEEKSE